MNEVGRLWIMIPLCPKVREEPDRTEPMGIIAKVDEPQCGVWEIRGGAKEGGSYPDMRQSEAIERICIKQQELLRIPANVSLGNVKRIFLAIWWTKKESELTQTRQQLSLRWNR